MRKQSDTKSKIVSTAWKLFYEQGFDNTTIEDIVAESHTSKGSFYHYFQSKNDLLGSLADLFDKKYAELEKNIDYNENSVELLLYLNRKLFEMIDNQVDIDLLTRLYSTQLTTDQKGLLDHKRLYYRLLKKIVVKGQEKEEIVQTKTANEIVKLYTFLERGAIYDWCLCDGDYEIAAFSAEIMRLFLDSVRLK